MAITRDALLSLAARDIRTITIPGLPEPVCMRALTGAESSQINDALGEKSKDGRTLTRAITARTICDEVGDRIIELTDVETLFDAPCGITNALIREALTINRMRAEDDAGK